MKKLTEGIWWAVLWGGGDINHSRNSSATGERVKVFLASTREAAEEEIGWHCNKYASKRGVRVARVRIEVIETFEVVE